MESHTGIIKQDLAFSCNWLRLFRAQQIHNIPTQQKKMKFYFLCQLLFSKQAVLFEV